MTFTATYSPEDNKLRLYASTRLDAELYARVKAAGFKWAPKQELFVAPMWTPGREDLLIELAGEIEDEDKSLVDRAEERAERFEDYSEKRADDAERAHKAVAAIADNIPFGQPILVGHHSERHARKDAEKIQSGMRKAVKMWETSTYWQARAEGAISAAKYKELPTVRARRIKTLEADMRRMERAKTSAEKFIKLFSHPNMTHEFALRITGSGELHLSFEFPVAQYPRVEGASTYEGARCLWSALEDKTINAAQAVALALPPLSRTVARSDRWIAHYQNRLIYERAMLDEQGASDLIAPKARPKQLPLLNYEADSIAAISPYTKGKIDTLKQIKMTAAEYQAIFEDYRGTRIIDKTHRIRVARVDFDADGKPKRFPSYSAATYAVFLTDGKAHAKPEPGALAPAPEPEKAPPARIPSPEPRRAPETSEADEKFKAMKQSLKAGIQVVAAPQLFPTPQEIAARMVELAEIEPAHRILEPSAGTGNILREIPSGLNVWAVEIVPQLTYQLEGKALKVIEGDFLTMNGDLGKFDRIVMNPPFENGADIKHIQHAADKLAPGGKLVALCANGPRQQAALKPLATEWYDLEPGSFKTQGTMVNVALLVIEA